MRLLIFGRRGVKPLPVARWFTVERGREVKSGRPEQPSPGLKGLFSPGLFIW